MAQAEATTAGMTLEDYRARAGQDLGLSDWITLDQPLIDAFAACTGDHQWIHVDRARAARESPFGSTVAHGFLVLSLLPRFIDSMGLMPKDAAAVLNYGLEKVRFTAPVPAGAQLRDRVTLLKVEERGPGQLLATTRHMLELKDADRPALLAEVITLFVQP